MNILVTGGSGFISRNIVKILKEEGNTVGTYDLKDKNSESDYHIMNDVRNLKMLEKACSGIDYVFHLAAVTSPPEFEDLTGEGYEVNVIGTYNVLAASAKNNVKRVILASSSSIYGDIRQAAVETQLPETYSNFYPMTKRINEMTAKLISKYGLETISLRYFNTYGAGENSKGDYSSVVWKFIDAIRSHKRPTIFGDGKQSRDFIYVEDTARASVLAVRNGTPGSAYNVGTGITTDFNTIFQIVKEEMCYQGTAEYVPKLLSSYQMFTLADVKKAKEELKFEAKYTIRDGVKKIVEEISETTGKNSKST
jgi:UDP-glucose 4-epimerase